MCASSYQKQSNYKYEVTSMTLKRKTLFITGASRGIGPAIAKRAAADGADIVIVAKTTDPAIRMC